MNKKYISYALLVFTIMVLGFVVVNATTPFVRLEQAPIPTSIYGEMYYANDTATSINFATAEYYYPLFMTISDELSGFTFNGGWLVNSSLTAEYDGLYSVGYHAVGDGQNNHEYHLVVFTNEEEHQHCEAKRKMAAGGDITDMGGTCFLNITAGMNVSLRIADYSGTGTGNYYNGNLNLVRIDDV